jgi:hypothetical protein
VTTAEANKLIISLGCEADVKPALQTFLNDRIAATTTKPVQANYDSLINSVKRQPVAQAEPLSMSMFASVADYKAAQAEPVASKVICPACCYTFRAIPQDVQKLMLDAGFEPPFTEPAQSVDAERLAYLISENAMVKELNGWFWLAYQDGKEGKLVYPSAEVAIDAARGVGGGQI